VRVLEFITKSIPMHKYGLALHTTSPQLGLALDNFAGGDLHQFRSQTWDLGHELGNQLHLKLLEIIAPQTWQDLGFLAVAIGPGSFTGTRLGVVTARTLAQQLDLPLVGISSFAAYAWWWCYEHSLEFEQVIALQSPAQRDRLFVGIYQVIQDAQSSQSSLRTLLTDTVITPEVWQEKLTSLSTPYICLDVPPHLGMTVTSLLDLAHSNLTHSNLTQSDRNPSQPNHEFPWSAVLPFYGQHPVEN
jgi:tRNA threonylcarbamoyl adenosine modification protein YeaZ